ncbi:MAG: biliverdin-producing heme oxygenase [Candidatus Nanopelagicales bacterium]
MLATDFSTRLRQHSMASHSDAEGSRLMTALFDGAVDRATYASLVSQLQPVYAALDRAAAIHRMTPGFGDFFDPRLARGKAIAADLDSLGGGRPATPATVEYATRITACDADPLLVLAHHYTRYLGDLSGGRAIAARLAQHLALSPADGLALYQFDVGPTPPYKHAYRQRLDALDLSEDDQRRFIAEVLRAYSLNIRMFQSLDHLL